MSKKNGSLNHTYFCIALIAHRMLPYRLFGLHKILDFFQLIADRRQMESLQMRFSDNENYFIENSQRRQMKEKTKNNSVLINEKSMQIRIYCLIGKCIQCRNSILGMTKLDFFHCYQPKGNGTTKAFLDFVITFKPSTMH